jgi:hypothetical protein
LTQLTKSIKDHAKEWIVLMAAALRESAKAEAENLKEMIYVSLVCP